MADAPAPRANPQTYDLRTAEGPKRSLVKLTVRGTTKPRDDTPDNLPAALLS